MQLMTALTIIVVQLSLVSASNTQQLIQGVDAAAATASNAAAVMRLPMLAHCRLAGSSHSPVN